MSNFNVAEMLDRPTSRRYARRLRNTTNELAKAVEAARDDIQTILEQDHLTDEAKAQRVSARRRQLLHKVDKIEERARGNLETARSGAPTQKAPRDAATAQLVANQQARAWSRAEKLLAAGRGPVEVAQFFAGEGDRIGLQALREELPAWGELNGTRREAKEALAVLSEIERPLLKGDEAEAALGVDEAEEAASLLTTNIGLVRTEGEGAFFLAGLDDDGAPANVDLGPFAPRENAMPSGGRAPADDVLSVVLGGGEVEEVDGDDE